MSRMANPTRPTITPELLQRIRDYYALPSHSNGGSLHIVLEDQNVEDSHIRFCQRCAREDGDAVGEALADELWALSKTQRLKIANQRFYPWEATP